MKVASAIGAWQFLYTIYDGKKSMQLATLLLLLIVVIQIAIGAIVLRRITMVYERIVGCKWKA